MRVQQATGLGSQARAITVAGQRRVLTGFAAARAAHDTSAVRPGSAGVKAGARKTPDGREPMRDGPISWPVRELCRRDCRWIGSRS